MKSGVGFSCLGEPRDEEIDEASVIEILHDWGWSGDGEAPSWYAEGPT